MNIHKNARLMPIGRERLVRETPQAARAAGVCPRTVRKWVARYKAEGLAWPGSPIVRHGPGIWIGRSRPPSWTG